MPNYRSHNGKSTIDLLFMKTLDSLIDCELIDNRLSEHSQISGTVTETVTRRAKLCPIIRKCDPLRHANNLEDLRNQVWQFILENVSDEVLCVGNGIRGCITRANTQPTKGESKAWLTSKNYDLQRRVKPLFKKLRDNPVLTKAKNLADAKKNLERECRMAKSLHVENTEKAMIKVAENHKTINVNFGFFLEPKSLRWWLDNWFKHNWKSFQNIILPPQYN